MNRIYIAGAHSRAQTLRAYLECLNQETKVISYLVDDMLENRPVVDTVPVRLITSKELNTDYPVYIGTRGVNHPQITDELKAAGFSKIIPLTVELDRKLRNEYVRKVYQLQGREFRTICDLNTGNKASEKHTKIYVACSAMDKPLQTEYST